MKQPKHRFEVTLRIGAHEWKDVIRRAEELVQHIEQHGHECSLVSGGGGGAHHVHVEHYPEQTEENYERELHEYVQWMRERDSAERRSA